MSTAFAVDDVVPARTQLARTSFATVLAQPFGIDQHARHVGQRSMLSYAGPESVVEEGSFGHPLVSAVHVAFARHYPLTLTPDAIWTTIAQGFALHIRLNAETLRGRFVEHLGKEELVVCCLGIPTTAADWASLVDSWCAQIRTQVGSGTADFFLNSFSTSGPVERTVSQIVMMDAFERYFDYAVECICGIPRVELAGTVDDWREVRRRIELMADCGVDDWLARLRDICDQFVESACGRPDRDFWQCIYKPREVYGGSVSNGWLNRLFPYLETESGFHPNPAIRNGPSERDFSSVRELGVPRSSMLTMTAADRSRSRMRWLTACVSPSSFPNGLCRVPVTLTDPNGEQKALELLGGLTGVVQDAETSALRPALGWALRTLPLKERSQKTRDQELADLAERWKSRRVN